MSERTPIGIIDFDKGEHLTASQIVERVFPRKKLMTRKDFREVRQTAYQIYEARKRQGETVFQEPEENWERAIRKVAIRRYLGG